MSGSSWVAVVNICKATCGLWLGCSPLTEMPDASRPATIALRASAAPACGRVIAMLRRDFYLVRIAPTGTKIPSPSSSMRLGIGSGRRELGAGMLAATAPS